MKRPVPKPKISGDASRLILRRTVVLMALFGVAVFVPLIMKLFSLQVMQYETLSQLAADNQTRISKITPPRGTVYDRNMNVLAVSADVENVCIDPNELGLSGQDLDAIADKLSELLDVSGEKIRNLMKDTGYRYQIVKRKVELQEAELRRSPASIWSRIPSGTIPAGSWRHRFWALWAAITSALTAWRPPAMER